MEIVNFFEKLAGRWFSQRTTHALSTQQSKAGKSDLEVEFLAPDTDEVQQLCQAEKGAGLSALTEPLCGLRIQQSSTIDGDTKPTLMTTLLVPLTPQDGCGTLLRSGGPTPPLADERKSTYAFADEVLTIVSECKAARSEERLWFINENLRMRTGMTELADGLRVASFCSEIRLGAKPPKQD